MSRAFSLKIFTARNRVSGIEPLLPHSDIKPLLHNHDVKDAQLLLPAVFSLCAYAQGSAAWAALTTAQGLPLDPKEHAARAAMVALESVQETMRSLVFALPESQRTAEMMNRFAQTWRESNAFLTILQQAVRKNPPDLEDIAQQSVLELWDSFCLNYVFGVSSRAWLAQVKDPCFADLPETPVLQWLRQMLQEAPLLGDIALCPLPMESFAQGKLAWRALVSSPYEVGAHRRVEHHPVMQWLMDRYGIGLITRFMARLFDTAQTLIALSESQDLSDWICVYPFAGNFAVATVETARGLLLHRAQTQNKKIAAYNICAPTDWNLNKYGALSTLLKKSAINKDKLYRHATWLVQALDPCVPFTLEIEEVTRRA
ncbi:MAG: hypothetical protein LBG61_07975 [Burkholderiales bacterium]|jgi:hypothetical protein|nr:hypothetical protein [Burkholderiales bacterium]